MKKQAGDQVETQRASSRAEQSTTCLRVRRSTYKRHMMNGTRNRGTEVHMVYAKKGWRGSEIPKDGTEFLKIKTKKRGDASLSEHGHVIDSS